MNSMINKIKEHRKDIEDDLTQAIINFLKKSEDKTPSNVSIKIDAEAFQKTVIHINIKD